ncbi:hypothetical protein [Candidatus Clostridium helianthi]|uniref:O-antigen ligase domain-containing protein n=1 Tax=Candidatus Clostridium helianthi TaxID=3381660 RepID=A0ABW8RY65_9CLOT
MIINNKIVKFLICNLINLILISCLFLSSYFGEAKYILYAIFGLIYILYLLKKDEIDIIKNQISYTLISYVVLDSILAHTKIDVPFELKYLSEIISIILIFKILINFNEYKNSIKDSIAIIIIMCIIINFIYVCITTRNLSDFFNGLRIYFRFLPTYIILSNRKINIKYYYYMYYFINLIIFIIQIILKSDPDIINGIFGLTGPSTFAIFIMIMSIILYLKFLKKQCSIFVILLNIALTFTCFVLQENKAFIFIFIIVTIITLFVGKGIIVKKALVVSISIIFMIIGINMVMVLFPKFSSMFSGNTMIITIEDYILHNNNSKFIMGRLEAIPYLSSVEFDKPYENFIGKGLGSALPNENWYYIDSGVSRNRQIFDIQASKIYEKYGSNFGYHLSSTTVLNLEIGSIGLILIIVMCLIFTIRACVLIRQGNLYNQIYGMIGIMLIISFLFATIYGSDLISRQFTLMIYVLIGIVTEKYKNIYT